MQDEVVPPLPDPQGQDEAVTAKPRINPKRAHRANRPQLDDRYGGHFGGRDEGLRAVLRILGRKAHVSWLLAFACAVYQVVVVAWGMDPWKPGAPDLLAYGAQFRPAVEQGDYWRMFTAMFLHVGIVHCMFNFLSLLFLGGLLERLIGHRTFLLLYLVSGLFASLNSLVWNTNVVSAGASGAIFGVIGALLVLLARRPKELSQRVTRLSFLVLSAFFGANMLMDYGWGLMNKGPVQIDMAAHMGGFPYGDWLPALTGEV